MNFLRKLLAILTILFWVAEVSGQIVNFNSDRKKAIYYYFAYDREHDEYIVIPAWEITTNGVLGDDTKRQLIKYDEREKWVKKFNKEDNGGYWLDLRRKKKDKSRPQFSFERNVADDSTAVIITIKDRDKDDAPAQTAEFPNYDYGGFHIKRLLEKDPDYTIPLTINASFKNTFGVNATKAFTPDKVDGGKELNGNISIQFYNDKSESPVGFYRGQMKNGLADGYGMFAMPCYDNGKTVFTGTKTGNRYMYYVRRGFWKNGAFVEENSAKEMIASLSKQISLKENFGKANDRTDDIQCELIGAAYLKDTLSSSFTNTFHLKWKIKWNAGNTERFVYYEANFTDFSGNQAAIDHIWADPDSKRYYADRQQFQLPPILQLAASLSPYPKELMYDDYTFLHITDFLTDSWGDYCGEEKVGTRDVSEYDARWDRYVSHREDVYAAVYLKTERKDFSVKVRPVRSADWNDIGSYSIFKKQDNCRSAEYYKIMIAEQLYLPNEYTNYTDAYNALVKYIKGKYPSPKTDNSITKAANKLNEKFEGIKQRLAVSTLYPAKSNDVLAGVWFDPDKQRIYLIEDSHASIIKSIERDDERLNGRWGYQGAMQKLTVKWISSDNLRVAAKPEYFDSNANFSEDIQDRPSKDVYIHEDLRISKKSADRIDFENKTYWVRLPG